MESVIDERLASPGLLLALLGQDAMRRLREAHDHDGLKPRQFQLAAFLSDHGPLAQGELGRMMAVDPSILVTLLNPLETEGLVSRERSPGDRRCHVVSLTPAGERRLAEAAQAQRSAEARLFAGLTDEQRAQLQSLLILLRDNLAPPDCSS